MKNLPNLITIARILLIPIFILLLLKGHNLYALGVFITAGISDALDGFIARTWNLKTKRGAYLDPVADKLLLVSSFVTLSILNMIPVWLMVIIICRDALIGISGMVLLNFIDVHRYQVRPSVLGKITTVLQVLTIVAVLVGLERSSLSIALWGTAIATITSGLHYIYRESRIFWA